MDWRRWRGRHDRRAPGRQAARLHTVFPLSAPAPVQPAALTKGQLIVKTALSYVGSLEWGSGENTLCETFTEFCSRCGWQGTSAIDAWQRNAGRQHINETAQVGDALYFGPAAENGGYGHTGIVTGPDRFTSVTTLGVKEYSISAWVAPLLGFIRYWER